MTYVAIYLALSPIVAALACRLFHNGMSEEL